jgi:hypothetical protein
MLHGAKDGVCGATTTPAAGGRGSCSPLSRPPSENTDRQLKPLKSLGGVLSAWACDAGKVRRIELGKRRKDERGERRAK